MRLSQVHQFEGWVPMPLGGFPEHFGEIPGDKYCGVTKGCPSLNVCKENNDGRGMWKHTHTHLRCVLFECSIPLLAQRAKWDKTCLSRGCT